QSDMRPVPGRPSHAVPAATSGGAGCRTSVWKVRSTRLTAGSVTEAIEILEWQGVGKRAPRRSVRAFFLFCEMRQDLARRRQERRPDTNRSECGKLNGKRPGNSWNNEPDATLEHF